MDKKNPHKIKLVWVFALAFMFTFGVFVGLAAGIHLTYEGILQIVEGMFEGSNVVVNLDFNETAFVEAANKNFGGNKIGTWQN